jgi:succinate dehydrogenase hydrophobic anchor subunit
MLDLRTLNQAQFLSAKRFWSAAIVTKITIFGLGIWAIFLASPPAYLPQILLFLAVVSELLQIHSDEVKSQAEALLRTLDICRSFGRQISEADKRDIVANVPRAIRKRFAGKQLPDLYFASTQSEGPKRAVENLIESAWYTRRQTGAIAALYLFMIIGLLTLSIIALIITIRETNNLQFEEQIIRVVTAWLLLIVSLNMLKSVWSYFKMYQRCQKTELICNHLLLSQVTEADALKQWYEYQMARASSPLLPNWLWRLMGPSLDDAWQRTSGKSP